MSQSNKRRKYLNVIILMCLLIIVVGFTPTLQQRLAAIPGQSSTRAGAPAPSAPVTGEEAARPGSGETILYPPSGAAGEIALPDAERIVQQAQLIRGELAARERAIAAQEDLLRRQVLAEFWKRQAAAAAATLGLALIIVLVLVRRAADWSGFTQRLREEESRLRNLQLSVIGALEEFESELAAARSWAAAEARSRRPAADRSVAPDPLERPAEAVTFGAPPAPAVRAPQPARPAEAPEPAQPSRGGFFFGDDEHVGAAVPMGSGELRRPSTPSEDPLAAPSREAAPGLDFQPEPAPIPAEPQSWARRFLAPEAPGMAEQAESAFAGPFRRSEPAFAGPSRPAVTDAGAPTGPWTEPARREIPTPSPRNAPRYGSGGPSTREQVERLASEGWGETEIARRLGLSREEIHLALMLGRSARLEIPAGAPYVTGPNAHAATMPAPGWQPQDRAPEASFGR